MPTVETEYEHVLGKRYAVEASANHGTQIEIFWNYACGGCIDFGNLRSIPTRFGVIDRSEQAN